MMNQDLIERACRAAYVLDDGLWLRVFAATATLMHKIQVTTQCEVTSASISIESSAYSFEAELCLAANVIGSHAFEEFLSAPAAGGWVLTGTDSLGQLEFRWTAEKETTT